MSEERFNRIEQKLDELAVGQSDLRREMRVLHEQVIDNIKAIPDPSPRLERMMDQKIAGLREEIGQRLDPLEAVVRKHFGT